MNNKPTAELIKYARKMAAYYHKSAKRSDRTNIVAYERTKRHADYNQQTADRLAEQEAALEVLTATLDAQLKRLDKISSPDKAKIDVLSDITNKIDEANFNAKKALQHTTEKE